MRFSVLWTPTARRLLAELWLTAGKRSEVQQAAEEIDRILSEDPLNAGESRVVNIRIIVEPPLAAYFDVHPSDQRVTVWQVWRIRGS
jgi:plasmid stabilization system protein ParE